MIDEKITPIYCLFLIIAGYIVYLLFDDLEVSRIIYAMSLHISLIIYSFVIFSSTSWCKLQNKILWLTVLLLEFISAIEFCFYQIIIDFDMQCANIVFNTTIYRSMSSIVNQSYFDSLILLFSVLFSFTLALVFVNRFYAQKSDRVNSRDIFLLFKKPNSIISFFVAIFTPATCQQYKIYCGQNNKVYEFQKNKKIIVKADYTENELKKEYVIFRISIGGKRDIEKLDSLIGCKYKLFKLDCSVFKKYPHIYI